MVSRFPPLTFPTRKRGIRFSLVTATPKTSGRWPELEDMKAMGFSVFAYDYHGYGASGGKANEQNAYEDHDAAYLYLTQVLQVPADRIIAHGRSLGGAVAIDLASRKPLGGLVVESSFLCAFRVVTGYPIFPFDNFETLTRSDRFVVRC